MKFIDEVSLTVQSGSGGRGCVSFRRERFVPRGGPDGGNGGRGGDVRLVARAGRRTLYPFRFQRLYKAENGAPGQGNQRSGKAGADLTIEVPPGTLVFDADTGELIQDLVAPEDVVVVAVGGRGGKGNAHFKTSTHQTPRFAQPGEPGQTRQLRLELKLLADVGIIGLPNAGKSTLISRVSAATPKIADYPFTTLTPTLGVVNPPFGGEPFVMADIPGLIEGAHAGVGLGARFLRHVERTRILVHLVDAATIDPSDLTRDLRIVNTEMERYGRQLAEKPQIVALNKIDLTGAEEKARQFAQALGETETILISAATGDGVRQLLGRIVAALDATEAGPR
ncbi:MAG: GTPase ObgE [Deltaproteobacteria bacterium]|nr:GTPase ObgE [Deltaproteobacteria bacterium]MBW2356653.1 GTPase ObgE [Deltaproteobacteria bacterium]